MDSQTTLGQTQSFYALTLIRPPVPLCIQSPLPFTSLDIIRDYSPLAHIHFQ